jgi:hypothetical protein
MQMDRSNQRDEVEQKQIGSDKKMISCVVANDSTFQLMAATYNIKSLGIEVVKEAINGM